MQPARVQVEPKPGLLLVCLKPRVQVEPKPELLLLCLKARVQVEPKPDLLLLRLKLLLSRLPAGAKWEPAIAQRWPGLRLVRLCVGPDSKLELLRLRSGPESRLLRLVFQGLGWALEGSLPRVHCHRKGFSSLQR